MQQRPIELCLTLRVVFGLPMRQTQGFVRSIFRLMDLGLPIPDFSTLSRRGQSLDITDDTGCKASDDGTKDAACLHSKQNSALSASYRLGILAKPHPTCCHRPVTEADTVAFQVFPKLLGNHIHAGSS